MRGVLAVAALAIAWSAPAAAQDFEAKLKKKLEEPFLSKAPWITDYDKAREEAAKSGKPIFAYFSRSYSP